MHGMSRYAAVAAIIVPLLLAFVPAHRAAQAGCTGFPNIGVLALGPNGTLLAGTRDGHVYRSVIGQLCWVELSSYPRGVEIGTVVVPPGRPHTILAGGSWVASNTPESQVLYRSEDDGATWTAATAGLPHTPILPVSIAVSAGSTLVLSYVCQKDHLATQKNRLCPQGLARSVDGGRLWHPVGPPAVDARNVVALPDDTFLALLALKESSAGSVYHHPAALFRSADDGLTWKPVTTLSGTEDRNALSHLEGISSFFAVPWNPADLLIGTDFIYFTAIAFRSHDGGAHWSLVWAAVKAKVHNALAEPAVVAFAALPKTHTLLFTDWGAIYRSVDGGTTWDCTTITPAADATHPFRFWSLLVASDGSTAYAGGVAGLYRSADDGLSWSKLP